MNWLVRALVLMLGLTAAAAPVSAQGGPNAFTVSGLNGLGFGTVFVGSTSVVTPSSPTAALFAITGPKRSQVAMAFALPASLAGAVPLPITFGAGSAAWSDRNSPAGARSFNPQQGATIVMPDTRTVYIWLGGTISPSISQPSGQYSSTVTLSVALN